MSKHQARVSPPQGRRLCLPQRTTFAPLTGGVASDAHRSLRTATNHKKSNPTGPVSNRRGNLDELEPGPHAAPTPVQSPQASLSCVSQRLLKLRVADSAVKVGKFWLGLRFPRRIILVHYVNVRIARQLAGKPAYDLGRVIEQPRHHQVAHNHPPEREAIFVDVQLAH